VDDLTRLLNTLLARSPARPAGYPQNGKADAAGKKYGIT
jgi:hypothetical protein